jgi:hypothetical protein
MTLHDTCPWIQISRFNSNILNEIQISLNGIQIQLKINKMQIGAQGVENMFEKKINS